MDTLIAQRSHFSMDPSHYPTRSPVPSSSHSSPRIYNDMLPPYRHNPSLTSARSLQISTSAPVQHHQELEEVTAHPSRMKTQLQHGHVDMETTREGSSEQEPNGHPGDDTLVMAGLGPSVAANFGILDEGLSRPLTHKERDLLAHLDRLKFFLATAPSRWSAESAPMPTPTDSSALPVGHPNSTHPALNRFLLPNSEYVSCVLWGGLYHITGTDIVRALVFRFEAFGRPVKNMKKFEEGVFSDLRNLKPGVDACLEEPKSPFLDLLFKYQCIRTQKKQKVFYWFSVPHDRLFLDALERDLKREKMGLEPTTVIAGEPALSFTYDPKRSLYDQFSKAHGALEGESELETAVRHADEEATGSESEDSKDKSPAPDKGSDGDASSSDAELLTPEEKIRAAKRSALHGPNSPFFSMFSLFEGSPTYKQRRKKITKHRSPSALGQSSYTGESPDEYLGISAAGTGTGQVRPSEPQIDRYGRDTTRLSAAEMFIAQARGEFGPQSNPDLIAIQKERQRRAMQARADQFVGKSYPNTYAHGIDVHQQQVARASPSDGMFAPSLHPSVLGSGGMTATDHARQRPHLEQRHTFPSAQFPQQPPQQQQSQPRSQTYGAWPPTTDPMGLPRTKAFVCPLFSCGRMFKRMEHLKRHLRTHTLERPYQCTRCKKRFSRSDNLNQHMRTHMRGGSVSSMNGFGDEADVESEEIDELEGDFDGELLGAMPDVQMCEVEIQGQVQEIQGDEEGLVMPTSGSQPIPAGPSSDVMDEVGQEAYFSDSALAGAVGTPPTQSSFVASNGSPASDQWAAVRAHPSPAFSTVSMPSPHIASSYPHANEFAPMSAPSQKGHFDHIFNSEFGSGAGPIRRHRSATPSATRFHDGTRRPYTASDGARSYHPYAIPGHLSQSANSSPMSYTVPLGGYESSHSGGHSRSSSSGQLQEQMQHMISMEGESMTATAFAQGSATVPGQVAYPGLYRTDSPMHFNAVPSSYDLGHASEGNHQGAYPMSIPGHSSHPGSFDGHAVQGYYSNLEIHPVSM